MGEGLQLWSEYSASGISLMLDTLEVKYDARQSAATGIMLNANANEHEGL